MQLSEKLVVQPASSPRFGTISNLLHSIKAVPPTGCPKSNAT